ncbi:allantoin racemase [Anaerobacterium chartisolvens]|uniref:Allantoin racemase n=1 Tax=Anaerobacterium chartisolvens TaxID=1297424 RepID=A0A369AQ37_9FIRM|nr:aspartate/glutamate racemase family protein [Anaerobacterium chartisolvens]RCX09574.1 allantoin racemase [Anaerobacterium chartisolvens]
MKKYLVINPNSSQKMTEDIRRTIQGLGLPNSDAHVVCMEKAPPVLESFTDYTIAGAEAVKYVSEGNAGGCSGILLACFGDPCLYALKECARVPVVGIAEASLSIALLLGFKFSIAAAASKARPMMESMVKGYGLESRMASVESLDLNIEDFINERELLENKLTECGKRAIQKGAEVLVLGCAGMTMISERVEKSLGIPVVDPVKAGMGALYAIAETGLCISRLGLYQEGGGLANA